MRRSERRNKKERTEYHYKDSSGNTILLYSIVKLINRNDILFGREGVVLGTTSSRARLRVEVVVYRNGTYMKQIFTRVSKNLLLID